jgi:parallel beta-helix repeat protein
VHDGTLKGFDVDMDLVTTLSEISGMTILGNHTAASSSIRLSAGSQNVLTQNKIQDADLVIGPSSFGNILIENDFQNAGISISVSGGNFLIGNKLKEGQARIEIIASQGNIVQDCTVSKGQGISANGPFTSSNLIRGNTVVDNTTIGISMGEHAIGNTISENTALRNTTDDLFQFELGTGAAYLGCTNTWLGDTFNNAGTFPVNDPLCIHTIQ